MEAFSSTLRVGDAVQVTCSATDNSNIALGSYGSIVFVDRSSFQPYWVSFPEAEACYPRISSRNVSTGAPSLICAAMEDVGVEEQHERVRSWAHNSAAGPRRRIRRKTQQSGLMDYAESEAGVTGNVHDAKEAVTERNAYKADIRSNTDGEVCKGCFQMKPSAQMLMLRHSEKDTGRCMGTVCRTCARVSCGLFQDEDGKEQLTRTIRWRCEWCNVAACKLCMPRVEWLPMMVTE